MLQHFSSLLAQIAPPANGTEDAARTAAGRTIYELSRLEGFDDARVPTALIIVVSLALLGLVLYLYRRDAVEMPRWARVAVMAFRAIALAGLLVFFLGIERRTTTEVVHNSQVAVLVDVSQSMALEETTAGSSDAGNTRIGTVIRAIADSPLVDELRKSHDVTVARFHKDVEPITTLRMLQTPTNPSHASQTASATPPPNAEATRTPTRDFWLEKLEPRGIETRLGQALMDQLRLYRDAPIAGIVVVSDGAQNAGIEPQSATEAAKALSVPIFTIGVGSADPQRNVAVRDLVVPTRAFPGDNLNVTGYLQASGFSNRAVSVELVRRQTGDPAGSGTTIDSEQVSLGADDAIVPVTFDVDPGAPGSYVFQVRIKAPDGDTNANDDQREAEVEVVDRQTRVLLMASGPMRDYQFLRNQLHRDSSMVVDVLLQTAQPGVSQDASQLLEGFPTSAEELYQYDCIVAFDPDWTQLEPDQIDLLEKWVADEAGGVIAVAGPIEMPAWTRSSEHATIRDLYPVIIQQRLTLLDDGHYGSETPWPLAFERAGREARFLWLEDTADRSEAAWDSFPGVYGYYSVKAAKPGATVYARFSDPAATISGQHPIYMAGHFYGAGQVFYIGSGEMWRLRGLDPALFEVFYTKLIRHVSQGRILRGSSRGSLLVERDRYELGETVMIRARLANAQHQPLELDSVTAQVLKPNGTTEPVKLAHELDQPGMYSGNLAVLEEGTYQIALAIPGSDEEPLSRYLQVRVPDLERTHARRNESLLREIASQTGGIYYERLDAAIDGDGDGESLTDAIPSRAEVKLLKGAADTDFARAQMQWLLALISGSLFVEWILRRINRLA